jgi:hypothetical protein
MAEIQTHDLVANADLGGIVNCLSRMTTTLTIALAIGAISLPVASADTPAIAQTEINYLLAFVQKSNCEFHRNGTWYDAKMAQEHLRYKYKALAAGNRIQSAEDFVEKAATKSSLTGRPYEIRCKGGDVVTTSVWLHAVLAQYRAQSTNNAPR